MRIQEFTEKKEYYVAYDWVTYVVTLKLSQSFKDKRCEGLKPKLYRGHVEVRWWSFKI